MTSNLRLQGIHPHENHINGESELAQNTNARTAPPIRCGIGS